MSITTDNKDIIYKMAKENAYYMQQDVIEEWIKQLTSEHQEKETVSKFQYTPEIKKQMKKIKNKNIARKKKIYSIYLGVIVYMFVILSFGMWLYLPAPLDLITVVLIWLPTAMAFISYVIHKGFIRISK